MNISLAQIKGTVSRDFLNLVFFIKHLLLVLLDTPRKDFGFFKYSRRYSSLESTPWCIHYRGVQTPGCIHHRGVVTPRCIHHRGVEKPR
jgi:hypothetical protein